MTYELREGQGNLFKNTQKQEGTAQPDYRGECMVGGELMEIAAWIKEGKKGKFMSLSVKEKRVREER